MEKIQNLMAARLGKSELSFEGSRHDRIMQTIEDWNNMSGNLDKEDGYSCDVCHNKGYIRYCRVERGYPYEYDRPCECQKVRAVLRKMRESGLKNAEEKSFDRFIAEAPWQKAVKQAALQYATDPKGAWFFVGGQTGAGKTHICTAICVELMKRHNMGGYYMLWRDEVARLKSIMLEAPDEYTATMKRLKTVDALYIDDLFKTGKGESPTKGDINLAFEVLNHRYNSSLPTIISSEYTLAEILDVDEAIGGRIAEQTHGRFMLSIAKDRSKNYRLKGAIQL